MLLLPFGQVLDVGFRSVGTESIVAKTGVGKTTIYGRWPNNAAVIMDAFTMKVGFGSLFPKTESVAESIRPQMRAMAKRARNN